MSRPPSPRRVDRIVPSPFHQSRPVMPDPTASICHSCGAPPTVSRKASVSPSLACPCMGTMDRRGRPNPECRWARSRSPPSAGSWHPHAAGSRHLCSMVPLTSQHIVAGREIEVGERHAAGTRCGIGAAAQVSPKTAQLTCGPDRREHPDIGQATGQRRVDRQLPAVGVTDRGESDPGRPGDPDHGRSPMLESSLGSASSSGAAGSGEMRRRYGVAGADVASRT